MLSSELKQAINGTESVPEDILPGLQEQTKVPCGRRALTRQYGEISANDHLLPTHIYGHWRPRRMYSRVAISPF